MINSDGNSNVGYTVVTRSTGLWLGFGEQRSNGFAKIATMSAGVSLPNGYSIVQRQRS